jgi:signal transduction histidine kinase/sugar lactone lactonase YvrE
VPSGRLFGFAQDREGTIWAATEGGLARLNGNRWKKVGTDWNFPGKSANSVFLDRQGVLWVATENTLVFLPPGTKRFQLTGIQVGQVMQIAEAASGKLWMADITRSVRPIPLPDKRQPPDETEVRVGSQGILFDKDGALWITSVGDGLRRSLAPELLRGRIQEFSKVVESFTTKEGLSDDDARTILQDHEGNIWVGTSNGLDRFRKTNLIPVSLPFKTRFAVLAPGNGGDVWVENLGSTVRVHSGRVDVAPPVRDTALSAYRNPAGAIWWLCYWAIYRYTAGNYSKIMFPPSFPKPYILPNIVATEDGSNALWLAAQGEGLFYREDGVWHRPEAASKFAQLSPTAAYTDWMGRAWVGFAEGTILIVGHENIQKIFLASESLVGGVRTINGRGRHIWIGGEFGLAFFDRNRFRRILPVDANTFGPVLGVEETSEGKLWLFEGRNAIEVTASELQRALDNPSYRVKYRKFDSSDGFPGTLIGLTTSSQTVQGSDGKLWLAGSDGIAWVDPARISTNVLPPPVLVRSVAVNGRQADSLVNLTLPPRTTNLEISYTALSLAVPEKVRFRYRLKEVDKDWQDAGARREAFYTRLGPGRYHFQVVACNNDGIWNESGAHLDFKIAPAWFQTTWFYTLCAVAFLALLWALYQLRLQQMRQKLIVGLEERVSERIRIARELHDTLLQSFQGAVFQFQAARKLLLRDAENAMQVVDEAIHAAEEGITEGRAAIRDLRPEAASQRELPELLNATGSELGSAQALAGRSPSFSLVVEGKQQTLSPRLQDEVYRISREILRNAFAHAAASRIEVEIHYDFDQLRLRIRDDGKGIDPEILRAGGQSGHWGIPGIRERAQRMGARLDFWSEVGAGTEVELVIPAAMAYSNHRDDRRFGVFRRTGKK